MIVILLLLYVVLLSSIFYLLSSTYLLCICSVECSSGTSGIVGALVREMQGGSSRVVAVVVVVVDTFHISRGRVIVIVIV